MTDDGATLMPGLALTPAQFRRRSFYLGYRAFGDTAGTILIDQRVARELRSAAEFATQGHRFTGGLLYGRRWADDEGGYLVVSGFLDAGPRESGGDWLPAGGFGTGATGASSAAGDLTGDFTGDFTLTDARLRLLRDEGARMYSTSLEVGWWRTLPALGEFGPADLVTQTEMVAPDGVGLLVYGSGPHWGTAYLGPDGHAPETAGTLVAVDEQDAGDGPAAGHSGPDDTAGGPYDAARDGSGSRPPVPGDAARYEPDETGPYRSGPGNTGPGMTEPSESGPYEAEPSGTGSFAAGPSETGSYETESSEAEPSGTGSYETGPDTLGPYASGAYDAPPDDLILDDTPLIDAAAAASISGAEPGVAGATGLATEPGPGTAVATRRPEMLARRPRAGTAAVTSRDWYLRPPESAGAEPGMPTDIKIVIGLALLAFASAAILIGVLMSSVLIAVIVAVVFAAVVAGFVWMSRL